MVKHGNQDTRPRRSPQGSEGSIPEVNKIGAATAFVPRFNRKRSVGLAKPSRAKSAVAFEPQGDDLSKPRFLSPKGAI
jgi:hypothetical protein